MTLRDDYAVPGGTGPFVRMNFVASIDGAATLGGRSGGLGDDADTRTMQALRANADVVAVGARTVIVEGYRGMRVDDEDAAWRVSSGYAAQPRIAVFSASAGISPRHPVFTGAVTRPILVTSRDSRPDRRAGFAEVADVVVALDLAEAVEKLAELAGRRILCEGGPSLFGGLVEGDLVDEVCLTLGPMLVAGGAPRIAHADHETGRRMALHDVRRVGDELFLRYARR